MIRRYAMYLLFAALVAISLEGFRGLLAPGMPGLFPTAEAVIGRPLTPVSVAGVARRTVRRCAVGIYYC